VFYGYSFEQSIVNDEGTALAVNESRTSDQFFHADVVEPKLERYGGITVIERRGGRTIIVALQATPDSGRSADGNHTASAR
jgi:hypothetical protein